MQEKAKSGLTEGPILQELIKLALPIMASAFLSTAYSITDMAWIGLLGSKAVAGVGVGGMYVWLAQGLATLARMGGQVQMGQAIGRDDKEQAGRYATAALQMVTVFGVLFGAVCLLFTEPLIDFYGLEDALTIEYAKVYLRITCGLILFSYVSYTLTGLYTAQGDSRTPLKANVIGLLVNMILDPVLILGVGPFPRLGVTGAAVATVIAQFLVLLVLVLEILRKKDKGNLLREISLFRRVEGQYYASVARIGVPVALQSSVYCFISMILTRLVGTFGEGAIATQRVGGQIESISWNTADGFAAAMNAFAAQNYGAGKMERVKKGYRISAVTMIVWGTLIMLAFLVFPRQISEIFFHEADVVAVSMQYLIIIGFSEPFMCLELMAIGAISGMGNTKLCSLISIVLTGLRIPLAYALSATGLGVEGVWWALTISSILKGITLHVAFYRVCKRNERGLGRALM